MNEPAVETPWDSARYLREILRAPVYEAAEHTPLQEMPSLSARLGSTVEAKREDLQAVHSFKIRGAYNAMRSLTDAQRARETFAAILARAGADEAWHDRSIYDGGEEEIIELARTFTGQAGLIVGHEPVISYAGYILARQEDRGAADRGVPTATALVLSFDGAWEDLAPETCAMRVFYTPPTR